MVFCLTVFIIVFTLVKVTIGVKIFYVCHFPTPFLPCLIPFFFLFDFFILSSLQTGGLNIGPQACQTSTLSLSSVPSSLFIFSFEIGSPQVVHIDLELAL